jgi:hypothetical protein
MTSHLSSGATPLPADLRDRLEKLRRVLLRVHKVLLDGERVRYERAHGRIETSGQFLQLAIGDPWFSWLQPLAGLIVQVDEVLAAGELPAGADAGGLLQQALVLLRADTHGTLFQQEYARALQEDPAAVIVHAEAQPVLRDLRS